MQSRERGKRAESPAAQQPALEFVRSHGSLSPGRWFARPTGMAESEIAKRSFEFARRIALLTEKVAARGFVARRIAGQLFDAASSIGANAEEAQAGQTKPDFIAKLATARKECFETRYWLRLLLATSSVTMAEVRWEWSEINQLVAMTVAAVKTAQRSKDRGEAPDPSRF